MRSGSAGEMVCDRVGCVARMCSFALAFMFVVGGCQRTVVTDRLTTDYERTDQAAEMNFWHSLPSRATISNDEALHGLILTVDGEDPTAAYEQRVEMARARGWVGMGFDEPPDLAARRGMLARAIAVACEIRGGIVMRLFGVSDRYATRELVYLGLMIESTENQAISGLEYLGVMQKVQDHLQTAELNSARAAPGEVDVPLGDSVPVDDARTASEHHDDVKGPAEQEGGEPGSDRGLPR
ncbi:MAG: hypothetical protein JNM07_00980 [Phycisphaerae bacterium]|nr:hypothetical protein [Phycisphaerae bacterium]